MSIVAADYRFSGVKSQFIAMRRCKNAAKTTAPLSLLYAACLNANLLCREVMMQINPDMTKI